MFKKVAFTMYPVKDVPRARRFYEETLGLKPGLAGGRGDVTDLKAKGVPFKGDIVHGPRCRMAVCEDTEGSGWCFTS